MYYESGMFPIMVANESTNPTDNGPVANGGELPPPPNDPPKS